MESSLESVFHIDPFDIEFEDWPQLGVATTPNPVHAASSSDARDPPRPESPQIQNVFASRRNFSAESSKSSDSAISKQSLQTAKGQAQAGGIVCFPPVIRIPFSTLAKQAHATFRVANHGTQTCRFRVFLATGAPTFSLELEKKAILYPGKEQVVRIHAHPPGWLDHMDEVCIQTNIGKELRVPVLLFPAPCPPATPTTFRVSAAESIPTQRQDISIVNPTPRTYHLTAQLGAGKRSLFALECDNVKVQGNDSASFAVKCIAPPARLLDQLSSPSKPTHFTEQLAIAVLPDGPTFQVPLTVQIEPPPKSTKPSCIRSPVRDSNKADTQAKAATKSSSPSPPAPAPAIPFKQLWLQHESAFRSHSRQFTPWSVYNGIPPDAAANLFNATPSPHATITATAAEAGESNPHPLAPAVSDRMDALFQRLRDQKVSLSDAPAPPAVVAASHVFRVHCRMRLLHAMCMIMLRCRMLRRLRAMRAWATATGRRTWEDGQAEWAVGAGSVLGLALGSKDRLAVVQSIGNWQRNAGMEEEAGDRAQGSVPQPLRPKSGATATAAAAQREEPGFNESMLVLLSEMELAPEKTRLIEPLPVVSEVSAIDEHGDGLGQGLGAGGADKAGDADKKAGSGDARRTSMSAGSKRGSAGTSRAGTAGAERKVGSADKSSASGSSKPGSSKGKVGSQASAEGGGGSRPSSRQGGAGGGQKASGKAASDTQRAGL